MISHPGRSLGLPSALLFLASCHAPPSAGRPVAAARSNAVAPSAAPSLVAEAGRAPAADASDGGGADSAPSASVAMADAAPPSPSPAEPSPTPARERVQSHEPLRLTGFTLKADCVDPRVDFFARADVGPAFDDPSPYSIGGLGQVRLDLDGDGTEDFVVFGGAERWQRDWWLYVRRGECGYFVGKIASSEEPRTLATGSRGLRDLHTASDECPLAFPKGLPDRYCETVWRFDGRKYVRIRETPVRKAPRDIEP